MKTHRSLLCRAGLLAAAALVAPGCERPAAAPRPGPAAVEPAPAPPVSVARVRLRTLRRVVSLPASIVADARAPLMANVPAYVSKVHVDLGDPVRRGDVLVELDAPELLQRVARREQAVRQSEADVELALAEAAAAESRLAAQRALVDLRASEKLRIDELTDRGAIAERRRDEAEFGVTSARAELASLERELDVASARVDRARARVGVARAELAEAEAIAGFRTIVAPFEGVITQRSVDPGVLVEPGDPRHATPLVTVADVTRLRAVVYLTAEDASLAPVGAAATLRLNDAPGVEVTGRLARSSGVFDAKSRMMRAEIDIVNPIGPDGRPLLRAGGYGAAQIVAREQSLPAAPSTAVVRAAEGSFVVVVGPGGELTKRRVELGIESGGYVGIVSGVEEGDRVVAEGADRLMDSEKIAGRIIEIKG